jgi:hypothetical protein
MYILKFRMLLSWKRDLLSSIVLELGFATRGLNRFRLKKNEKKLSNYSLDDVSDLIKTQLSIY